MSDERLPGIGRRSTPRTCPACGTHIRANPQGTTVVRLFMSLVRLNENGTETGVEPKENRCQLYHLPCWQAAVERFNRPESDVFRTG